jgi:hypothetical protein
LVQAEKGLKLEAGAGVALGAGVGTALGVSLHNLALGLAIGVALGVGFSAALSQRKKVLNPAPQAPATASRALPIRCCLLKS